VILDGWCCSVFTGCSNEYLSDLGSGNMTQEFGEKKYIFILNWSFLHETEFPLRKVNSGCGIITG
jgi:hypothetical protein